MAGNLLIEDARILFRNFEGNEGMYNQKGDRNFCVLLEPELAQTLEKDGWNIKTLRPKEEGDEPQPYMQVAVSFKNRPPRLVIISSRGRTDLNEEQCAILDWVDIHKVDLVINPYHWTMKNSGASGVKAYLKSIFITIEEDALERKYADVEYAQVEPGFTPLAIEGGQSPAQSGFGDESGDIVDAELVD